MVAYSFFKFPKLSGSFDTMKQALGDADKHPFIGVTQGGSSREDKGAKVAATIGEKRPNKKPRRT